MILERKFVTASYLTMKNWYTSKGCLGLLNSTEPVVEAAAGGLKNNGFNYKGPMIIKSLSLRINIDLSIVSEEN